MSYSIEYNSIFIKSRQGITPIILMGDNNVWSCDGRRRERSWSCWCNFCGASAKQLQEKVDSMLGESELWMKNGRWVDGEAAVRWIRNGIKKASSMEDILKWNHLGCATCYLTEYESGTYKSHRVLHLYCKTNEEFDHWLDAVANYRQIHSKNIYATVSFDREDIRQPTELTGPVILKQKSMYVSDFSMRDGKADSVCMEQDISKAKVFASMDDIPNLSCFGTFHPIKAKAISAHQFYLEILNGPYTGYFVRKVTSKQVFIARYDTGAYRYSSKAAAEQAKSKLQQKFNLSCELREGEK